MCTSSVSLRLAICQGDAGEGDSWEDFRCGAHFEDPTVSHLGWINDQKLLDYTAFTNHLLYF